MIVHLDEGETISDREQRTVKILCARDDLTVTWSRYAPGERGPDLHVHHEHTDAFYVLEGELTFELGPDRRIVRAPAGTFVAAPPNVAHSFYNASDAQARWLNFHAPDAGFAAFMRGARDGVTVAFDSFGVPADGGLSADRAIVSPPGDGERLVRGNRVAVVKGALADISLTEFELDGPFAGPDLHDHDDQLDAFYVLDGELEVTVEQVVHAAGAGTLAAIPRGTRHTFGHRHEGRARFLNVHAPDAGFADYLRGVSSPGR